MLGFESTKVCRHPLSLGGDSELFYFSSGAQKKRKKVGNAVFFYNTHTHTHTQVCGVWIETYL